MTESHSKPPHDTASHHGKGPTWRKYERPLVRKRRSLLHVENGVATVTSEDDILVADHPALEPTEHRYRDEKPGRIDRPVFLITAALSVAFVLWGVLGPESLSGAATVGLDWVVGNAGWFFVLAATGFVFFVVWLALSKFGRIPLGLDGETPEFSTRSWVAMMFSAGMGIGLMFFGAAEPLYHFITPPPGVGESSVTAAMSFTMFHWALHPWAIYAVVGVAIAYSVFRKGRPLTISAVFEPLIGERHAYGPAGKVIDIFAIFATLFGSATSLGLGALQVMEGFNLFGISLGSNENLFLVVIITVLTVAFILSAVSGVGKGIKLLADTNMVLALALALFVFVLGPTIFILNLLPTTLGSYLSSLMEMSALTGASAPGAGDWLSAWTIFYWAWWVSWTPFVGMFIARISRGRTIREFVAGVLLVPSAVSLVWFSIFGGAAINAEQNGAELSAAGSEESMLFALLDTLPLAGITTALVIILVSIFFVSGADAGSMVMGTLAENGTIEPRRWNVIFWGAATGLVAAVMVTLSADALSSLQSIIIVAGLPFVVVMIGMAVSLVADLQRDPMIVRQAYAEVALDNAVVEGVSAHGDDFALAIDQTVPGEGVGALVDVPTASAGDCDATGQTEDPAQDAQK